MPFDATLIINILSDIKYNKCILVKYRNMPIKYIPVTDGWLWTNCRFAAAARRLPLHGSITTAATSWQQYDHSQLATA